MKKTFSIVTESSAILFVVVLLQGQIFAGGLGKEIRRTSLTFLVQRHLKTVARE